MISYRPLRHLIVDKRISKMWLCKAAGMSTSVLSKINNDKPMSLDLIDRMATVLSAKLGHNIAISDMVEIIPTQKDGESCERSD